MTLNVRSTLKLQQPKHLGHWVLLQRNLKDCSREARETTCIQHNGPSIYGISCIWDPYKCVLKLNIYDHFMNFYLFIYMQGKCRCKVRNVGLPFYAYLFENSIQIVCLRRVVLISGLYELYALKTQLFNPSDPSN